MKFFSLLILLLASSAEAAECLVTTSAGGFEAGSLLTHLNNGDCSTIRFQNGIREIKLIAFMRIHDGMQLIGNPGVSLLFDPDTAIVDPDDVNDLDPITADPDDVISDLGPVIADPDKKDCLLHVSPRPPRFRHAPVKISNLILTNVNGRGICFEKKYDRFVTGDGDGDNLLQNLVIRAGTIGIDLGSADLTRIENVTIEGQGDEAEVGVRLLTGRDDEGRIIGGMANRITGSTIRHFKRGVEMPHNLFNLLRENRYLEILEEPERGLDNVFVPTEVRTAFVRDYELTLTGVLPIRTLFLEVYKYSLTPDGTRKNYEFLTRLDSRSFVPRDPRPDLSRLPSSKRRFFKTFSPNQLRPEESVVIHTEAFLDGTRSFSQPYSGRNVSNQIQGHPRCNDVGWFWLSFDRRQADESLNRGWTFNYDGDGHSNGEEDLNHDCWFDRGERDPRINDDIDGDGVLHNRYETDNCPTLSNQNQADQDQDGVGDACDHADVDGDGFNAGTDNCPDIFNPDQRDSNGNGIGDACEELDRSAGKVDTDKDSIATIRDNCPFTVNSSQIDTDGDGVGDGCDPDDDNDGLADAEERLGFDPLDSAAQAALFGIRLTDPKNPDTDRDGFCDGPGMGFLARPCVRPLDNCPLTINRDQLDRDEDGIGDACDKNGDSDGDRIRDEIDSCPNHFDFVGGTWDFDPDGVIDEKDVAIYQTRLFPPNFNLLDNDLDGVGNACDSDDDNDGLDDATESGIFNPRLKDPNALPNHWVPDVDKDSLADGIDFCPNFPLTDIREKNAFKMDTKEYIPPHHCGNYPADDIDGDGIENRRDNCRFVPNRFQLDLDNDGLGDACDLDDDNDDHVADEKAIVSVGGRDVEVDPCFFYLYNIYNDDLVPNRPPLLNPNTLMPIPRHDGRSLRTVNDKIGCATLLAENPGWDSFLEGCLRTCDFDESANFRLHPWDPNSDHYNGRVFGFADQKCDGAGTGFGGASGIFSCKPADFCPEYYNRADSQESCIPAFTPSENVLDRDNDGIPDDFDNCPDVPNGDQSDIDGDRAGDLCDDDIDGDFVLNTGDNCPYIYNPDQTNLDNDDFGDACDPNPPLNISTEVQGGGCRIASGQKLNFGIFSLILASIGLIGVIRQRA